LLGMVPKSPSSNRNQQGRLCWVLLWSYACVLISLAVSIMLYCPLLAKNVCTSTFLVQWLLGVQFCLWWLGSVWPSLGFKGNWFW
jgi:small-conductance mechanosensitive channel